MKKAWEIELETYKNAIPKLLKEEEQTWLNANEDEERADGMTKLLWNSNVPGSFAPESIMTAALQSIENMGYVADGALELLYEGYEAKKDGRMVDLQKISAKLWNKINNATKDENHKYWTFGQYKGWEDYEKAVTFAEPKVTSFDEQDLKDKMYAGWVAQIAGGALGTAMEGYSTKNIEETLGNVTDYVRKPNTYNDDITFELAFLFAYEQKGKEITSEDVALEWIGYIPTGWSAEDIALRNIRYGTFPPLSGTRDNPFSDWIGAQMRGAICGMLAPGDAKEAARLACIDAVVSHSNNGMIGEAFNAMLVALSFAESDVRTILKETIDLLPKDSEYFKIVDDTYQDCLVSEDWREVWARAEERVKEYNWIHAYPNAAAEVVALYYGDSDFDKTMNIIAMCGQDVDCNAAQIMSALGVIVGINGIDSRWKDPIGDRLDTYIRVEKVMSIKELSERTVNAIDRKYIKG